MFKRLIVYAALFGFIAVALGAFGAHALKDKLTAYQHEIYNKGVMYQMFHVMAILASALLYHRFNNILFYRSALSFSFGIVCFSGSLYLLACKDLLMIENTNILGPITPIGGLFFLAGWLLLLSGALRIKE